MAIAGGGPWWAGRDAAAHPPVRERLKDCLDQLAAHHHAARVGEPVGACGGCQLQHWREDAYLGWRSGTLLAGLGENALDFTLGRTQYRLGHGMLLCGLPYSESALLDTLPRAEQLGLWGYSRPMGRSRRRGLR